MARTETWDFIVIGGGLSGLLIAEALRRNNYSVRVLEETSEPGGCLNSSNAPLAMDRGLKTFFNNEETKKALSFLNLFLSDEISYSEEELPPVTFEEGSFKPFVGFGSRAPKYNEEIAFYTTAERLMINRKPKDWASELVENLGSAIQTNSKVTEVQSENGRVTSVTVNGSKKFHANNFIFTAPPLTLKSVLFDHLSPRTVQKLSKGPVWSTVTLDLIHSEIVTEQSGVHVLIGGTDDSEPCLGLFHTPEKMGEETVQVSQWMVFLSQEEMEEDELAGLKLREIKKQIKRAYPEALDNLKFERILYSPHSHGNIEIKLTERMTLPGLENFYVQSGHLSSEKNLVGVLTQAQNLTQKLGLDTDFSSRAPQESTSTQFESAAPEGEASL